MNARKITTKFIGCAPAREVVKRFPGACAKAYAAQGSCTIRSRGTWRCHSRIIGALSAGAPSKESCRRGKARIAFVVAYFPPTDASAQAFLAAPILEAPSAFSSGPYDERNRCVNTADVGVRIPPLEGSFEIHAVDGVAAAVGRAVQQALVAHRVSQILHAGLGSDPRNSPARIEILLTPRNFDRAANIGITSHTCANSAVDGIVVRTNLSGLAEVELIAAHELFHAYSLFGVDRDLAPDTWWEEASATWFSWKGGFADDTIFDVNLQFPNYALDASTPASYQYAMSRFVQFLDSRGLIGAAFSSWPLELDVIHGYVSPGTTKALAAALERRGTSLGAELAAFWGDRIRARPLHGPRLVPAAGVNAAEINVSSGTTIIPVPTKPLHTRLIDFTLAHDVKRVEFEFDPPRPDGYFWGAISADVSKQFLGGDYGGSVSFCVGAGDEDDLRWPGHFPVTFTNGKLSGSDLQGKITVRAQTDTAQCTNPKGNRACQLLIGAQVWEVIGHPGSFHVTFEGPIRNGFGWQCSYGTGPTTKPRGAAVLGVSRLRLPPARVRRIVRNLIEQNGLRPIKVGDLAGIGKLSGSHPAFELMMAVGKEIAVLIASARIGEDGTLLLARRIAGEL